MTSSQKKSTTNWFYIKHASTNKVISTCQSIDPLPAGDRLRSQVFVTKQKFVDNELWCWDDNYLRSKSTGLVLDIRKGRLRLIKDTEICLYYKKTYELSNNQLWAVRPAAGSESTTTTDHPLFKGTLNRASRGSVIYSICNSDWVLDVCCPGKHPSNCQEKLVLFPQRQHQNESQVWEFVPEGCAHTSEELLTPEDPGLIFNTNVFDSSIINENSFGYASSSSSFSLDSPGFAHGLSPAKRSSQTSLSSMDRKKSTPETDIFQISENQHIHS